MVQICVTEEEATVLKQVLHAVYKTYKRIPGMNIGSSQVHNLYLSDIQKLIVIHDKLSGEVDDW